MSDKSPLKKRANPEKDGADDLESGTKRQRTGEKDSKTKQVVPDDESSQDFDAEGQSGDDSFDDDFDAEESAPEGDDDFDLEKYKKWREEQAADEGAEGGEDEMLEGEEGEADNSDDYGSEDSK